MNNQKEFNVAIIPARGGSKRIKNKNIKFFYSKPIIQWTFEIIKKSKMFKKIVLTSDSKKILNLGKKIGFDILIERPKNLSNDFIGTDKVIMHSIKFLNKNFNIDNVCCVYPCNPLLQISDLLKAKRILKRNKNSFIFPIASYSHPIERAMVLNKKNSKIKFISKKKFNLRTQDLNPKFYDAGQFYIANKSTWLKKNKLNKIGMPIPNWRVADIDNLNDWKKAELIFTHINN